MLNDLKLEQLETWTEKLEEDPVWNLNKNWKLKKKKIQAPNKNKESCGYISHDFDSVSIYQISVYVFSKSIFIAISWTFSFSILLLKLYSHDATKENYQCWKA